MRGAAPHRCPQDTERFRKFSHKSLQLRVRPVIGFHPRCESIDGDSPSPAASKKRNGERRKRVDGSDGATKIRLPFDGAGQLPRSLKTESYAHFDRSGLLGVRDAPIGISPTRSRSDTPTDAHTRATESVHGNSKFEPELGVDPSFGAATNSSQLTRFNWRV